MSLIQRAIQVGYQLRVYFTEDVFHPANVVLRNILGFGDSLPARRALVVLDEALAAAQPGLAARIESYFSGCADSVNQECDSAGAAGVSVLTCVSGAAGAGVGSLSAGAGTSALDWGEMESAEAGSVFAVGSASTVDA